MPNNASFAGPGANASVPELLVARDERGFGVSESRPEHPVVHGGRPSLVPPGTVIELDDGGGYKVVDKPTD